MHPALHSYVVEETTYSDREVIIEEGSKGSWIYVILEGIAKVKKRTPKGMVTVDILREGEVFGEITFLEAGMSTRSASVIAADGEVREGCSTPRSSLMTTKRCHRNSRPLTGPSCKNCETRLQKCVLSSLPNKTSNPTPHNLELQGKIVAACYC